MMAIFLGLASPCSGGCDGSSEEATSDESASATSSSGARGSRCVPIDPGATESGRPSNLCFSARVSDVNLLTLSWELRNASPAVELREGAGSRSLGFRDADCDGDPATMSCSTSFRVDSGGTHTYSILVTNADSDRLIASDSALVHAPSPPSLQGGGRVDMLNVEDQSISWSHEASCLGGGEEVVDCWQGAQPADEVADEWVEIRPANLLAPWQREERLDNRASPFVVRSSDIAESGIHRWLARYCVEPSGVRGPADDSSRLCSANRDVNFIVGPARWKGPHWIELNSPVEDLIVSHTNDSGDAWVASSDTLVDDPLGDWTIDPDPRDPFVNQWVNETTYRVAAAKLTPGHHRLILTSCVSILRCSNREDLISPVAGIVRLRGGSSTGGPSDYEEEAPMAVITPETGRPVEVLSPASGRGHFAVADGQMVAAGGLLAVIITENVDVLHIVVDGQRGTNVGSGSLGGHDAGRPSLAGANDRTSSP